MAKATLNLDRLTNKVVLFMNIIPIARYVFRQEPAYGVECMPISVKHETMFLKMKLSPGEKNIEKRLKSL
ncbi:hypothetical protein J7L27_00185 [Candidatus Bathyarchaeota archaeon]|nr:hypothetical protein [Candidatus Bathyarchaeota archaeon]